MSLSSYYHPAYYSLKKFVVNKKNHSFTASEFKEFAGLRLETSIAKTVIKFAQDNNLICREGMKRTLNAIETTKEAWDNAVASEIAVESMEVSVITMEDLQAMLLEVNRKIDIMMRIAAVPAQIMEKALKGIN